MRLAVVGLVVGLAVAAIFARLLVSLLFGVSAIDPWTFIGVTFVLLAVANRFVPQGFPLKRLSSPAQTFLVMNAAALAAVAVFFIPATRLWKPTRVASR